MSDERLSAALADAALITEKLLSQDKHEAEAGKKGVLELASHLVSTCDKLEMCALAKYLSVMKVALDRMVRLTDSDSIKKVGEAVEKMELILADQTLPGFAMAEKPDKPFADVACSITETVGKASYFRGSPPENVRNAISGTTKGYAERLFRPSITMSVQTAAGNVKWMRERLAQISEDPKINAEEKAMFGDAIVHLKRAFGSWAAPILAEGTAKQAVDVGSIQPHSNANERRC